MATKNRSDLKSYFVKNAIPTEGNFADLIDSQLNQTQDGVFKPDGDALSVVAASGDQKRVLRLYASYPATNPDWMISLNPVQDPATAGSVGKLGFGITDGAGKTRLFIDAATGQIGVGTNTPKVALDVNGTVQAAEIRSNGSLMIRREMQGALGPTLTLLNSGGSTGAGGAIDFNGYDPGTNDPALRIQSLNDSSSSSHLTFSTKKPGANTNALVERLRLTSDGLLRFSNEAPKDKIVIWDGGTTDRFGIGLNNGNINLFYPTTASFSLRQNSSSGTEVFSVSAAGDVTAQGSYFNVKGSKNEQGYFGIDGNGVLIGCVKAAVNRISFYNATSTAFMDLYCGTVKQASDERLKDNIEPIPGALDKVVRLQGVSFDWKVDCRPEGSSKQLGLVAQQVRQVVPEAVVDAKDSLSITYNAITALLIEAVKEQQKQLDELRAALTPTPA